MKQIYLSGPITGLTYDNCNSWRDYAIKSLAEAGLDGRSPLRAKEYLKDYGNLMGKGDEYLKLSPLSGQKGITTRDRFDTMTCDALLVNLLGAPIVSIGTVLEIGWADAWRKPIVLVIEEDKKNIHEHAMINEVCGFRVPTLEDGIAVLKAILS